MRKLAAALLAVAAGGSCGSRTGTLVVGADGSVLVPAAAPSKNTFCAANLGPVDSCDAGPNAGGVQFCGASQYCVWQPGAGWNCCNDVVATPDTCSPETGSLGLFCPSGSTG